MTPESAIALAQSALIDMAGDDQRMGRFLGATGVAPGDIRRLAANPSFLGAVLTWLMDSEAALLAFCENNRVPPQDLEKARQILAPDMRHEE